LDFKSIQTFKIAHFVRKQIDKRMLQNRQFIWHFTDRLGSGLYRTLSKLYS